MKKALWALAIITLVFAGMAQAGPGDARSDRHDRRPPGAPEIDPGMAVGGLTALAGGLTLLRHYRRRR